VLKANSPGESGEQRAERNSSVDGVAADRITLRLRHGDRTLAAERAGACGMKTGSYLAMLIHNHVRGSAVLPPNELDLIKATGAQLAALGRQLRMLACRTRWRSRQRRSCAMRSRWPGGWLVSCPSALCSLRVAP